MVYTISITKLSNEFDVKKLIPKLGNFSTSFYSFMIKVPENLITEVPHIWILHQFFNLRFIFNVNFFFFLLYFCFLCVFVIGVLYILHQFTFLGVQMFIAKRFFFDFKLRHFWTNLKNKSNVKSCFCL